MPRLTLPVLLVYANPWHTPLDHNHRVCSATPWDPKDNPQRVFVGAEHRLDNDGELYFEYSQFEGTHGLKQDTDKPDDLVLRKGHAPIRVPGTHYFLQRLRAHEILPADLATHVTAFGSERGFSPIEKRAESLSKERTQAHQAKHLEDPDPKPRPAHGAGRLGMSHAHAPVSAVIAAPKGLPSPLDAVKAPAAFVGAAADALTARVSRTARAAAAGLSADKAQTATDAEIETAEKAKAATGGKGA